MSGKEANKAYCEKLTRELEKDGYFVHIWTDEDNAPMLLSIGCPLVITETLVPVLDKQIARAQDIIQSVTESPPKP